MKPLISVIVPIYNVERYLRKCVDSILNQTYSNLEVILVDDGSPDNCGAICDEYAAKDPRVRVIHKENGGQASARNAALEISIGEYVTFVDADDWVDAELYQKVISCAPFDAAMFGCTYMNEETGESSRKSPCNGAEILVWKDNPQKAGELLRNSLYGYACNKIYSRAVIGEIRMPEVPLREDLLFNIWVFAKTDWIQLIDCSGYYYVQHEGSTLSKTYSGAVPDFIAAAEQMLIIHPQLSDEVNSEIANYLVKQYLCDSALKYIFQNTALSEKEKVHALNRIFQSRKLRNALRFYPNEGGLFRLLTVCMKIKAPRLFYKVMRRKWNG